MIRLHRLSIRNFVWLNEAHLYLDPHLNILMGETGAGKSLTIHALRLVAGERADRRFFPSHGKTIIEAEFHDVDTTSHVLQWLEEQGLDADETRESGELILRRELTARGRSRAFINDSPVPLELLQTLAQKLLLIQTQFSLEELSRPHFLHTLFSALNPDIPPLEQEYHHLYSEWKRLQKRLEQWEQERQQLLPMQAYFQNVVEELSQYPLEEWKNTRIQEELDLLQHAEVLQNTLQQAFYLLEGYESDASSSLADQISQLAHLLRNLAHHGIQEAETWAQTLQQWQDHLAELSYFLGRVQTHLTEQQERLHELESVRDTLFHLQHKYRTTSIEDLLHLYHQARNQIDHLQTLEISLQETRKRLQELETRLRYTGQRLHSLRMDAGELLVHRLRPLFEEVRLASARLEIQSVQLDEPSPDGTYRYRLLFQPHPSVAPLPLERIASGGERTRILLCFYALLQEFQDVPILVLDEPDTGISGETARKVGAFLRKMADKTQLLVVTHLPPVARAGTRHFLVEKVESPDDQTPPRIQIQQLSRKQADLVIENLMTG